MSCFCFKLKRDSNPYNLLQDEVLSKEVYNRIVCAANSRANEVSRVPCSPPITTCITTFLFNMIVLRCFGEDGVATVTIIIYVHYFFIAFYIGIAIATMPIVSYNVNSGKSQNRVFGSQWHCRKRQQFSLRCFCIVPTESNIWNSKQSTAVFIRGKTCPCAQQIWYKITFCQQFLQSCLIMIF